MISFRFSLLTIACIMPAIPPSTRRLPLDELHLGEAEPVGLGAHVTVEVFVFQGLLDQGLSQVPKR